MAQQDTYSYQVNINGQLQKDLIDADSPQEAIEKVVHRFNRELVSIKPSTKQNFNACTNLVKKKSGEPVTRASQSFYLIETKVKEQVKEIDNPIIFIRKIAGKKKDAFRCIDSNSIPDFLHESVRIENDTVLLRCIESKGDTGVTELSAAKVALNLRPVIAYEKLDPNKIKDVVNKIKPNDKGEYYNVWWKKNADTTLEERNGVFYEKANGQVPIYQAQVVTPSYPVFLGEAAKPLLKQVQGGWDYKVSWSNDIRHGKNYAGYWVRYGEGDFNFLEIGTPSADDYVVCNSHTGKPIRSLKEQYHDIEIQLRPTGVSTKKLSNEDITKIEQIIKSIPNKNIGFYNSKDQSSSVRAQDENVKKLLKQHAYQVINYDRELGLMIFDDLKCFMYEPRNVANPYGDIIKPSNIRQYQDINEVLHAVKIVCGSDN